MRLAAVAVALLVGDRVSSSLGLMAHDSSWEPQLTARAISWCSERPGPDGQILHHPQAAARGQLLAASICLQEDKGKTFPRDKWRRIWGYRNNLGKTISCWTQKEIFMRLNWSWKWSWKRLVRKPVEYLSLEMCGTWLTRRALTFHGVIALLALLGLGLDQILPWASS